MDPEEFKNEVCICGHGAGWHCLAWLSWKKGEQTQAHCEYSECKCVEFSASLDTLNL